MLFHDSNLLSVGRVENALWWGSVLADAVGRDDVDDTLVCTFEAEAAPSAHSGGIGDDAVGAAGPFVMCEKEGSSWLVNG